MGPAHCQEGPLGGPLAGERQSLISRRVSHLLRSSLSLSDFFMRRKSLAPPLLFFFHFCVECPYAFLIDFDSFSVDLDAPPSVACQGWRIR